MFYAVINKPKKKKKIIYLFSIVILMYILYCIEEIKAKKKERKTFII